MLSDEALVEKTKLGDKHAFEELVMRYRDSVYFTIKRLSANTRDSEDILQEVFLSAFKNIGRFDPSKASFKTWLFTIVKNCSIDAYRRSKATSGFQVGEVDELAVSISEEGFEAVEAEDILRVALAGLSNEQRVCVILRAIGGLSYKEIAEITGVSTGTVKSRISLARKNLVNKLPRVMEGDASCNAVK